MRNKKHQNHVIIKGKSTNKKKTQGDFVETKDEKKTGLKFHSMKAKIALLMTLAAVFLTIALAMIGLRQFVSASRQDHIAVARGAVALAAESMDADRINVYLEEGKSAEGYEETLRRLKSIRKNTPDIEYLYVYQIRKDGCHTIFDADESGDFEIGELTEFDESFLPLVPSLLDGQEIEPLESNDKFGWLLSVYKPVRDSTGKCVCYVGADISMNALRDYKFRFITKIALYFSGILILIIALGIYSASKFTKPIHRLQEAFASMARGDLTERVERASSDEIGELSDSFNSLAQQFGSLTAGILGVKDDLARSGKHLSEDVSSTTAAISDVEGSVKTVGEQLDRQKMSVYETAEAARQITGSTDTLENMVEKQSESVEKASAAIEAIVGNIDSVNATVGKMAESFSTLEENAQNGFEKQRNVNERLSVIERQSDTLHEANQAIAAIAEQTNLLAMNAAIEAAHAGEAGKGFSVVADEIRQLAETSGEQSKRIAEQLNSIRDSIAQVVEASTASSEAFTVAADKIRETNELVTKISTAMSEQNEDSKRIGESLRAMNDSTDAVQKASKEMAANTKTIRDRIDALQSVTEIINDMMGNVAASVERIGAAESSLSDISSKVSENIGSIDSQLSVFKV